VAPADDDPAVGPLPCRDLTEMLVAREPVYAAIPA